MSRLGSLFGILTLAVFNSLQVNAQNIPKAECVSAYGETKCGYNCQAAYGEIRCADWPGGVCQAAYGDIACGPPAPSDWFSQYTNSSNSDRRNSGIYGVWAVQLEGGRWNGILRMRGNYGNMVLVTSTGASVEQKMTLKVNPEGGYILDGEVLAKYTEGGYSADNFYIKQFAKGSFSVRNCDDSRRCNSATLVHLGE